MTVTASAIFTLKEDGKVGLHKAEPDNETSLCSMIQYNVLCYVSIINSLHQWFPDCEEGVVEG